MAILFPDLALGEERQARKDLGAFYSPDSLVLPMVQWALRERTDRVLDPSCGDGVFLEAAVQRLLSLGSPLPKAVQQVCGFDLSREAVTAARGTLSGISGRFSPRLRHTDFFSVEPDPFGGGGRVEAVVGNPPYIRYQKFAGATRTQALLRAEAAGAKLSRLSSSWAPFVAHAISFLKDGGRLGFILPAEIIHASYAAPLRRLLRESFRDVVVISFRGSVFPGVQEEIVVLLADGRASDAQGQLRLVEAGSAAELFDLEKLLRAAEVFARGEEPGKWIPWCGTGDGALALTSLESAGHLAPLREIGKAGIGFVSGANTFFVLTPSEARSRKLPSRSLVPCMIKARQLPGLTIEPSDVDRLRREDDRCLLWLPKEPLSAAERAYEAEGRALGISERYKCRVRKPWYLVPGVVRPQAFLTYMSDAVPRLCLNEAGIAAANTLLVVSLAGVPPHLLRPFAVAFYNSATLLSCEMTGRSYGGGVLKLEPREADKVLVPAIDLVRRLETGLLSLFEEMDAAIRSGSFSNMERVIRKTDELLLVQGCGLPKSDLEAMRAIGSSLRERRRNRKTAQKS